MISSLSAVRVREIDEAEWRLVDPAGTACFTVNTPAHLAAARRIAAAQSG
jgi:hypothetical protein